MIHKDEKSIRVSLQKERKFRQALCFAFLWKVEGEAIFFSFIRRNRSYHVDVGILKHECGWVKGSGVCDLFDCIPSVSFQILLLQFFLFIRMSSTCCKWKYPPEKLPRLITRNLFKQVCLCERLQRGLAELLPKGAESSSG